MKILKMKSYYQKGIVLFFYFFLIYNQSFAQQKEVRLAIESYYSGEDDITKEKKYNPRNFSEVYPFDPNGFLVRGLEKYEAGFYEEAHSDFSESIKLAPDCGICFYYRGNNFMAMDSLTQAKIDLFKSIKFDPLLIESYNDLGSIYIYENNLDSAKLILQNGIDYYPAFPYTYFNLGLVETLKNKPSRALKQFRKCLELEPCHLESYSYILSIYFYRKNLGKAESVLNEALDCNPENSEFYLWKSIVKIMKSRNKDALAEISKAIEVEDLYSYSFFRGMLNVRLKQYSNALGDFTKAFELNPLGNKKYQGSFSYKLIQMDFQEILFYYSKNKGSFSPPFVEKIEKGISMLLIENYDEAFRIFNKLIKQKKEEGFVYLLLGITNEKLWKKNVALGCYNKSIKKDKKNVETYKRRGLIHQSKGNLNEAINDFSKMYELDKKSSEALKYKGIAKILNRDYEGGLKDFKEYEMKFKNDTDVFYNIGQCHTYLGKYEKGIKYYQKVLKENPKDEESIYKISENYYALGNLNKSFSLCDTLLKYNECNTMALNLKGVIQKDSLLVEGAIDYFTKSIECSAFFVDGFINRSMMYLKKGNYTSAVYDANKAIHLDGKNSLAYLIRAQSKFYLKDKTACSDLNKAIELGMQISQKDRKIICN